MSGTLDEISLAIGGLQQGMRNVEKTLEHILDEIKGNSKDSDTRFAAHEVDIQSLKNFRSRIYGITGTVSVLASAIGTYIGRKT